LIVPAVELGPGRNHVIHTHGGDGAIVSRVELVVHADDDRAHTIEVRGIELLVGSGNAKDWFSRTPLAVENRVIAVPAGARRVYLTFAAVEVYNACERFAFAVDVVIDGDRRSLEVPLTVEREAAEP